MEQKLPIDDLFREKLAQGREIPNLGAWANMERMLDGKNPYSDETQEKKKKRILPFLGLFLALTALLTAGYWASSTKSGSNKKQDKQIAKAESIPSNQNNIIQSPQINENKIDETSTNVSTPNQVNQVDETIEKPNIKNENTIVKQRKTKKATLKKQSDLAGQKNVESSDVNEENINSDQFVENQIPENDLVTSEIITDKKQSNLEEKKIVKTNKIVTSKTKKIKEIQFDTIPQVLITESVVRERNGKVKAINHDTISIKKAIKETEIISEISMAEEKIQPVISAEKSNPRLIKLSMEDELKANTQIQINENNVKPNSEMKQIVKSNLKTESIAKTPSLTTSNNKQSTFFQDMANAAKSNFAKVANSKFNPFSGRITTYPGISVGMNAALIGSKHNFGGFHFGLTDLIPISDYLNILTELKVFIRNNSGFTINDVQTINRDKFIDNTSLASQNKIIYGYQIDSTNKKYNFKNFTSLELPIMVQRHFGSFSAYGGLNLAYNFGLDVKEIKNNYASKSIADTLSKFDTYSFPNEQSFKYARSDFKSQFGLGYTLGTSYHFNSNIYVDLRLSQTVWNTAKTASTKEISNGVFKVPSFQFSIGYRFRKYTTGSSN